MKTQRSIRTGLAAMALLAGLATGGRHEDALASAPTFAPLALTVQLEPAYCRTTGTQCLTSGVGALAGNRNPVRVVLQVVEGAVPVSNLTDAQINVLNSFAPAGGTQAVQTTCPSCFQAVGSGMYAIFVNPANGAVWKSGSYHVQVQVTVGVTMHRALAQIEIPF
jgi:hypothetical protein